MDDLDVHGKRTFVVGMVTVVMVISHVSYAARLYARRISGQVFQADDYIMGLAFPFSYIPAICLYYGLTVGLGKHIGQVSKPDQRKFNISLFVLQRGNPPCLWCVKTSILLLYVRFFRTPTFKKWALAIWIFTTGWAISAFFSNMLQCLPISYQWNKDQPGKCLPNALINVGLTNGILSFVGDLAILVLPLPMIWKLHINRKSKIAVSGMFLLGGLVCVVSILRFVALASINVKDITFSQVDPGVWTYVELGIGITCGNLPLLRPLFGKYFGHKDGSNSASNLQSGRLRSYIRSEGRPTMNKSMNKSMNGGGYGVSAFDRASEERIIGSTAEIESASGKSDIEMQDGKDFQGRITVQTDVNFLFEESADKTKPKEAPGIITHVRAADGRAARLDYPN